MRLAPENKKEQGDKVGGGACGGETGVVTAATVAADPPAVAFRARETRRVATNRWVREGVAEEVEDRREQVRRECLQAGLPRHEAVDRSWETVLDEYPPPGMPAEPEPVELEPHPPKPAKVNGSGNGNGDGLAGLGDLPAGWPDLPANASLAVEVQWVQSNRLRVRDGNQVDLTRALSPAPSHSALSWLETAILYPAKWADITAKASSSQDDDREVMRRERIAVDQVVALLAEMREPPAT